MANADGQQYVDLLPLTFDLLTSNLLRHLLVTRGTFQSVLDF